MIQESIATATNTSVSFVSLVETGKRACKRRFAEIVDEMRQASGQLVELWDDLYRDGSPVPSWFVDWATVEGEAAELLTWQPVVVPGLLQTEDYARALLPTEEALANRIKRQAILLRDDPAPTPIVALLGRAVLTYCAGGVATQRAQLDHLIDMAARPNVLIQVVPYERTAVGTGGACVLATMPDRSEIAYLDTTTRGITTDAREDIAGLSRALMLLRAEALPESMSLDLIKQVQEDLE
ncbi:hypothetical protein FHU30_006933 [Actinomadura rupiterrae]|nr:DUF5753 domain-containing protein [Actinomadura rupiterrae]MCP2341544.1 hypothetical protein [Actinomadura rupiterrae]